MLSCQTVQTHESVEGISFQNYNNGIKTNTLLFLFLSALK